MSKLSHYQKMSSGPSKRPYARGSSKKATAIGSIDAINMISAQ